MKEFRYINNEHQLIKDFFDKRRVGKLGPYFIAIGCYKHNELTGVMTIGKPTNVRSKYDFAIQDMLFEDNTAIDEAVSFFHDMYDGKIEKIDIA